VGFFGRKCDSKGKGQASPSIMVVLGVDGYGHPTGPPHALRLAIVAFVTFHAFFPLDAACVPMVGLEVCPGWNGQLATAELVSQRALLDERADNITRSLLKGNTEAKLCGSSTSACCQSVRKLACAGAVKMLFRELGGDRTVCPMENTTVLHGTCISGAATS
jgi:hypothetical protein